MDESILNDLDELYETKVKEEVKEEIPPLYHNLIEEAHYRYLEKVSELNAKNIAREVETANNILNFIHKAKEHSRVEQANIVRDIMELNKTAEESAKLQRDKVSELIGLFNKKKEKEEPSS